MLAFDAPVTPSIPAAAIRPADRIVFFNILHTPDNGFPDKKIIRLAFASCTSTQSDGEQLFSSPYNHATDNGRNELHDNIHVA